MRPLLRAKAGATAWRKALRADIPRPPRLMEVLEEEGPAASEPLMVAYEAFVLGVVAGQARER